MSIALSTAVDDVLPCGKRLIMHIKSSEWQLNRMYMFR